MTRVLIVLSVRLYLEGLAELLNARDRFTVVGIESRGADAVDRLDTAAPDVLLVDMGVPDLAELASTLGKRSPRVPLVSVGIDGSDADVLACAEMGIVAYVTREQSVDDLAAALESAGKGELLCSPRTAGVLVRRVAELAAERQHNGSLSRLTRREREVAKLLCEDLSNKEIATRLRIEVATVKNHIHSVLDKLSVHRRADAARLLAPGPHRPSAVPTSERH